jgi:hypothetical protein
MSKPVAAIAALVSWVAVVIVMNFHSLVPNASDKEIAPFKAPIVVLALMTTALLVMKLAAAAKPVTRGVAGGSEPRRQPYQFAHQVLRDRALREAVPTWRAVSGLGVGEFLIEAWLAAGAGVPPDRRVSPTGLRVTMHELGRGWRAAIVHLPAPENPTEAYMVALAFQAPSTLRYFVLERGVSRPDAPASAYWAEWRPGMRVRGGDVRDASERAFVRAVAGEVGASAAGAVVPRQLATRSEHGTIIIDLRASSAEDVASGAALEAVRAALAAIQPPSQIVVWMIPIAAFVRREDMTTFFEAMRRIGTIYTEHGAPAFAAGVLAGTGPGLDAFAYLLNSAGMKVFAVGADDPPPLIEARTTTGQLIRGLRDAAAYRGSAA